MQRNSGRSSSQDGTLNDCKSAHQNISQSFHVLHSSNLRTVEVELLEVVKIFSCSGPSSQDGPPNACPSAQQHIRLSPDLLSICQTFTRQDGLLNDCTAAPRDHLIAYCPAGSSASFPSALRGWNPLSLPTTPLFCGRHALHLAEEIQGTQ
jgi:hypothetical protein